MKGWEDTVRDRCKYDASARFDGWPSTAVVPVKVISLAELIVLGEPSDDVVEERGLSVEDTERKYA